MKQPYVLQPSELEIIQRGQSDADIITDYFFRPEGEEHGFLFDANFEEPGKWQKAVHSASQTDIIIIGGFGTGKTFGVGMSAAVWAMSTPNFKFLNVSEKAWQAKQMYDMVLQAASGTPYEKLIWARPMRPFPKITLKFRIGRAVIESSLEFMSADKNATGILSWEGDWINIDEAGLLDNLDEVVTALGSRLRGSVRGRSRLGRLSMTSNSWDNHYMWSYFDTAASDPDGYLSMVISTRHNKNVSDDQLEKMLKRIPESERERWIDGARPEGKGKFFPKPSIYACEDSASSEKIKEKVALEAPGYAVQVNYGIGVVYFESPPEREHLYVVMGDPGIDAAPRRNSPVVMTWGVPVTYPNDPAKLVNFWWGTGEGAITPFVDYLLRMRRLYNPVVTGVDATGPQKNMAEIINVQYLGSTEGFEDDLIAPMDFSGSKKAWYNQALRMMIEAKKLRWPKFVSGIRSQLANYDPARDQKIAQDIVATMAMSAFAIRSYFYVDPDEDHNEYREHLAKIVKSHRESRATSDARTQRSAARSDIPKHYKV